MVFETLRKAGMTALMAGYLFAGAAGAEDTEIFFNANYDATTQPNVLFIFDTSGSMEGIPSGDSRKKIEIIQEAMKRILDDVSGVNIGLARFSVPGGPILYPVVDVAETADPIVNATVLAGSDDAEQAADGSMNLSSSDLDLGEAAGQWVGIRLQGVNVPQGATIEDAVLSFYVDTTSATSSYTLRIAGQAVDNAPTFTTSTNNISDRAQTGATVDWSPVQWVRPSGAPNTQQYSTTAITNIIQEIVNRPGWCGGNSIVLMIKRQSGASARAAKSYENDAVRAPTLRVKYNGNSFPGTANRCYTNQTVVRVAASGDDVEEDSAGAIKLSDGFLNISSVDGCSSCGNNRAIGLRFQNLPIPRSADITSAKLTFYAGDAVTPSTTVRVKGIASGDVDSLLYNPSLPPGDAANNRSLTSLLPQTSASKDLTYAGWSTPGADYSAPESLDNVIEEIIGRGDWDQGNDLGLILTYQSGSRIKHAKSYENGRGSAAKLTINFKGVYAPGSYLKREELKQATDGFKALGNTPISDTLAEAALYYRGEEVYFGRVRGSPSSSENRVSHPESYTGGSLYTPAGCNSVLDPYSTACKTEQITGNPRYKTPITDSCQSNHIVYLTDGEPTSHNTYTQTLYNRWTGGTCLGNDRGQDCTKKIARFLKNNDQLTSMPGTQTVTTHTVGFDIASPFLEAVATNGGGGYYEADSTDSLVDAFRQIIASILQTNATFVSAGVTVSQSNRLTHEDRLYFALFGPTTEPRWPGNLKRYRLDGLRLRDVNDLVAVNPLTDQFVDGAQSWWSPTVDGNDPKLGGAASQLTNARTIYTNLSGTSNVNLTDIGNRVIETNSGITQALLGAATTTERTELLKWARGIDVDNEDRDDSGDTTDAHHIMGDPLHSRPTLIRYKSGGSEFLRVFLGTNPGFLHAFDADNGSEQWAFMPQDLLRNLKTVRDNNEGEAKPYGLDATISAHIIDGNNNGVVDVGTSGEAAYLYVGMRRGGNKYYAFDVSNPSSPKLMFVIAPGAEFTKLGQTWSSPVVGNVKIGSTTRLSLIFGGGYDTNQDFNGAPSDDSRGNAVYIADALTGAQRWSSDELTEVAALMTNSVPSNVAALDLSDDGVIDHFYVTDTRAQVFRFDALTDGSIKGYRLAQLQPPLAGQVDNRRFYASVDAALINRPNGGQFMAVSVGSGYREHPLDTVINDHFYVIRDTTVISNAEPEEVVFADGDLVDVTAMLGDGDDDGLSDALEAVEQDGKHGWYIDFDIAGEKVLAEAITLNNVVYFSTYIPPSSSGSSETCTGAIGGGRFYAVSVLDGTPVVDVDGDGVMDATERYVDFQGAGAFAPPTPIITESGNPVMTLGPIVIDIPNPRETVKRLKWRRQ